MLAPGHDAVAARRVRRAARRAAPRPPAAPRRSRARARARCRRSAPTRSASPRSTASSTSTESGSRPTRSRCCRRSASSTPAPPASWRSRRRTDAELEVPGLGGELKPFQRAGVSYLLAQRRAFLADEQGLGKTIEALATLEADGAYPAVVVCPASLKLNWLRELERWLPTAARGAQRARAGRGARRRRAPDRRGTRRRGRHGRQLRHPRRAPARSCAALGPRALVLDESHYCKNAARQAHPGGAAARRRGPARRPRARAHRHAR